MSRHRDVRNLEDEYHADMDYGSSYGSSYCDEVPLSTSVERQYMFTRNVSGTTPKLNHFLGRSPSVGSIPEESELRPPATASSDSEDETSPARSGRRHSSSSSLLDSLNEEDQTRLAQCLESILDIVGESMPEIQVKETIVRCDFDAELALNTLLNNPIGVYHDPHIPATEPMETPASSVIRLPESRRRLDPQPTPWSPPASVLPATQLNSSEASRPFGVAKASGYAEIFLPSTEEKMDAPSSTRKGEEVAAVFATPMTAAKPLAGKKLDIRSRSPSPALTKVTAPSSVSTPGSSVKMRKKDVNVVQMYNQERGHSSASSKELLNLVVVGHVDSGKSTLMGHLLFKLGQVSSKAMHKYEQESKKLGKASFAYAWVLDETAEERERGITMDVAHSAFETKTKTVTLLDAPGHRDFIPNMISGAYQADVAILVVNATRGEFEAGFDQGGQTREHALLVRSLGVVQLVVAVNKLDTVDWSKERFDEITEKIGKFLKQQVGFKDQDLKFVPVSGFTGNNLIEQDKTNPLYKWYGNGQTLIQVIDDLKTPERLIQKAFKMSISDIFKPQSSSSGGGFCVAGRIESGFVQKNDTLLVSPLNELAIVKNVLPDNPALAVNNDAFAGDHVSLTISGVDQCNVAKGMVLCDPASPVKVSRHFAAKIVVLNVDIPIIKGFTCVLHHAGVTESVTLNKLIAQVSKSTGEVTKRKPKILAKNSSAQVEITTDTPICLETFSDSKELGRFMLRYCGSTVAAGLVTDIF